LSNFINYVALKAIISGILAMFCEASEGAKGFFENELYEFCSRQNPEIAKLHITTFVEMVFSSLLKLNLPFGFRRVGIHSHFSGICLREDNNGAPVESVRYERPVREYRRVGTTTPTMPGDLLEGCFTLDPDGTVSLSRLEKMHEAVATEEDIPFPEFLQALLEENDSLSKSVKPGKKAGKKRKYIKGLALTESGKKLLDEEK
jgi:hypothetical protein